ncbi:glycosyltransferase family 39 protein [Flavobacterium solisilvae]|uniref:Glycosyltransferase RgtA/B/C/D-like domain-containing protein n=1 Tax=Flavobacterium solisilvae TaxID=1852019 RepID=A0ABX1QXY7_9FLAO|nr:glycosyltransferase family 39 protein [Flavobacterium solisilvae]NMH25797.1 hypothetical protein [Flavobacterium solisilvae]
MNKVIPLVKENKWLLLILLLASFLRFYHLDFQSLWMDEIYTMNISSPNNSFSTVIDEVNLRDGFPYIYFITLKILHTIFGYTAIVARTLSVIGGLLSIGLIYKLTNKLINQKAALIAAFLMCISSYHIYISQDARPYTLYLAATIFVYYRLLLFLENSSLKNSIYYAIAAGILINTNFFGFINLFSQFIFISFYLYQTKTKIDKNLVQKLVLIGAITIVMFLPNWTKFTKLFEIGVFWVPRPTNESFGLMLKEVFINSEFLQFIYVPIFYYLLFSIFKKRGTFTTNKDLFTFLFLIFWLFIFLIFLLVKSYGATSLILTRYFTSVLPVIFIVIAWGIQKIKSSIIQYSVILLVILFTFINMIVVNKYYSVPSKAQFREASLSVIKDNPKKHMVYTSQKYWFDYYFNLEKSEPIIEKELETLLNEMESDSTKLKSFWFVDAFGKTFNPSDNANAIIAKHFVVDKSFDGFQAWAKHFVLASELPQRIDLTGLDIKTPYSGDSFMSNIEIFETVDNKVNVSGWAYFNGVSSENTKISLVLINEKTDIKNTKIIPSQSIIRPDVTTYFKCSFNADNSGFKTEYDINLLETGIYKLGVYVENKKEGKRGLLVSDKYFEKK